MSAPGRHESLADRTLWPAVLALAVLVGVFEFTEIDLGLQDQFYDFATRQWLVDRDHPVGRALFYHGPKVALGILAVSLLALIAGPADWRTRWRVARPDLGVALLTLATLPVLAGLGKQFTNVYGPSEIVRYGGDAPYVALCEAYPVEFQPVTKGHCFPAGHASGGFALMALAWLRPSRRWRIGGLALGLGAGWWMGGYQMLKGAHYLSHTVVTMLLAWIVILAWRRVLRPPKLAAGDSRCLGMHLTHVDKSTLF